MEDGIIDKPSQSQLQSTYQYLCDNPAHLDKINITELRYLLEWIDSEIPKESKRIEPVTNAAYYRSDGTEGPLSEKLPYQGFGNALIRLQDWRDTVFDRINTLLRNKTAPIKGQDSQTRTLLDIWKGTKEEYENAIKFLKKEYIGIDSPFVSIIQDKLQWNKVPQKGWVQYLSAFIHMCLAEKCIADIHSAPEYVKILSNTFNIDSFDSKPFKTISTSPPKDKYLKPFKRYFRK